MARLPLLMGGIEPPTDGRRADCSENVDAISIYISGSITYWLNQCFIRSHNIAPVGEENPRLCPARGLVKLWGIAPDKCRRNTDRVCESWRPGKPIKPGRAVSLLWLALFGQGLGPSAFSSHPLREWGRRRYIARRATSNWSPVLGVGGQLDIRLYTGVPPNYDGARAIDGPGGHTLHRATRDLINLRPTRK